jgi:hypothetical protein
MALRGFSTPHCKCSMFSSYGIFYSFGLQTVTDMLEPQNKVIKILRNYG